MTTHFEDAQTFRRAFGQPILPDFCTGRVLHKGPLDLQTRLIAEEHLEFQEAVQNLIDSPNTATRVQFAKELGDLVFTSYQAAAAFSIDLDEVLKRILNSNMSKLGEDGKPIYRADGKVLKGPRYKQAELSDLVRRS